MSSSSGFLVSRQWSVHWCSVSGVSLGVPLYEWSFSVPLGVVIGGTLEKRSLGSWKECSICVLLVEWFLNSNVQLGVGFWYPVSGVSIGVTLVECPLVSR